MFSNRTLVVRSRDHTNRRGRYPTISDSIPAAESSGRMDRQHSFRPSSRDVHDLICAEDHRGKSPAAYVEHSRVARATKFVPHPAILSRLYDFLFGVCGLSVLHFRRFDLTAQQEHANTNHFNARNFSASVELPKLTGEPCLGDLKAALGVLGTYCIEFFDGRTRRLNLLKNAVITSRGPKQRYRLSHSGVATCWLRIGLPVSTPLTTRRPHISAHGVALFTLPNKRNHQSRAAFGGKPYPQPPTSKRTVPVEVGLVAPREEGGKQLCLRFISKKGCPSTSSTRCTHPWLAHFVPKEKIDPVVKKHVQDKLGGLRSDLFHL
ncbi:hypothetical protein F442_05237 [Phytophthora nicotianae P10297]|uniref:Uncharacterized protein n=1 Tax=Phytophthora nicotianae P10297 TaxID=1317064 RepID=W2ZPD0_PHYNI|nr:hypothetical protein F442_05237 [Phytophthora nicotianae P10297]